MAINIYSAKELPLFEASGRVSYDTHMLLRDYIKPGVSTYELNQIAQGYIEKSGGKCAFLGYHGFPGCLCTSVNDHVVHGIPSKDQVLADGDIISIDLGVNLKGYFSDTAWTWPVGTISPEARKLIEVTQKSLYLGIKEAIPGNKIGAIGEAIQKYVEANGYSVVRALVGHGVGKNLHEDPPIPNYGRRKDGPKIKAGMMVAIEPMINQGTYKVVTDSRDKWTVRTLDGKLSAHFEHSVAITSDGPILMTLPKGSEVNVIKMQHAAMTKERN